MQLNGNTTKNNNELIVAAAGSGKTSTLVRRALDIDEEQVLITTFTEANEFEIKKKIIKEKGFIPENLIVQTWFSFLLENGVRPFQGQLNEELWDKNVGFMLVSGNSSIRHTEQGTYSVGKDNFFKYYFSSKEGLNIFSDKVSEFTYRCNEEVEGDVVKRISRIYPHIFIDEVQDLAGYDLDLLKLFFESDSNILLVGDPRQGTYSTNDSRRNKGMKRSEILNFFEDESILKMLNIDKTSLATNYRCVEEICKVADSLFPNEPKTISGQNQSDPHLGVYYLNESDIEEYLSLYPDCVQLRWDISVQGVDGYQIMNFGDSKGLTFRRVLIYPTKSMSKWFTNTGSGLAPISRSKLYVGLTRAELSAAIVCSIANPSIGKNWRPIQPNLI